MEAGEVYLVGAGPGDPGLLTLNAVECLNDADVVYYDYLVNPDILEFINPEAEAICISKGFGDLFKSQEDLNQKLVEEAKAGKKVVRLKGGDPFIFGRGGEEALTLAEAGVTFRIIPGITSGIGACEYSGIPATHRDYASCITLVTGHESDDKDTTLNYNALAKTGGTLVFYMGRKRLLEIASGLIKCGLPGNTPAAVIRWATRGEQITVTGTLGDIASLADRAKMDAPVITVISEVVSLREKLNWFERLPLFGKKIMVTGTRRQSARLKKALFEKGALVIDLPLIEIQEPDDYGRIDSAIDNIGLYDWLVFTSSNGVEIFMKRIFSRSYDIRKLAGIRIAAIGEATADSMREYCVNPDIVSDAFTSAGLLSKLSSIPGISVKKFLLARAESASPLLSEGLKKLGSEVTELTLYKTRIKTESGETLYKILHDNEIDIITVASSSAADAISEILGAGMIKLPGNVRIVSIGPVTSGRLRELGREPDAEASPHSVPGVVRACLELARQ
ncbi:MAG: uroporphyrinogen-III C-methyltransferase [Chloroflexi bacterium]|nr:uroporphyrinogen-III C-methyltransferase [Chloroflexota bacterium]